MIENIFKNCIINKGVHVMLIVKIYYILFYITLIYSLYFAISGVVGICKKSKLVIKKSKKKNHFAIIIAARNEEKVIGNLVDSLKKLDYPKDKYSIFVVPNNCTDNTSKVACDHGAGIIECNVPTKTKGDVLKYAFEVLKDSKEIDAYLIFDADNLVHKDFLIHMNDALNSGYNVAEGCRDSKNPKDNWISGSYTIFYLFQNIFFNQARMGFNSSASINGTGFMIKKSLIDENGFNTYTLTEDVEFTGQCALNNEPIAFVEDAITYDEYPNLFDVSWKQRKRWSSGIIQCMKRYSFKLFKNFLKTGNMASLDMALVYLGPLMQVISFINIILLGLFKILGIELNDIFSYLFATHILFFAVTFLIGIAIEYFALIYKKKGIKGMFISVIMFFVFIISWIPINIICFVSKYNKWDEIKHTRDVKIDEILD